MTNDEPIQYKVLTLYLAGAIRDSHPEDIEWREEFILGVSGLPIRILNPLAGKMHDPATKSWSVSGVPSTAKFIVHHDRWCVDQSDILVFNFRALSQQYPNIGTLVEFGRATGTGALIYSIVDPDYTGHENPAMYRLHPFIEEFSAVIFPDVPACIKFCKRHLLALSGMDSRFAPGTVKKWTFPDDGPLVK